MNQDHQNKDGENKLKTWIQITLGFLGISSIMCTITVWICMVTPSTLTQSVYTKLSGLEPKVLYNTNEITRLGKDIEWMRNSITSLVDNQRDINTNVNDVKSDIKVLLSYFKQNKIDNRII